MVESEREMLRPEDDLPSTREWTTLQRTYEDSIPPSEDDWALEQD